MSTESYDLVSVIIPVHNGDRYLAEAIESTLAQTYRPVEIIVIDDGSTDNSAAVAQQFSSNLQYYFQQQQGAAAARNHGIDKAQGTFLAFLDADDLWEPNKLALQTEALRTDSTLHAAFGQVQQFYSPELADTLRDKIHCPTELMAGYLPSAVLVRRNFFEQVGRFETDIEIGEFVSWYARAQEAGIQSIMLPDLVARRRLHLTNQTQTKRQVTGSSYLQLLKTSLDRRRALETSH